MLPWLPALTFLSLHIISFQLLRKTAPAATSGWGEEGETPSQHMSSAGAGAAADLGNAGFFSSQLQEKQEVRHSWLALHSPCSTPVFFIISGTLSTLTQEYQGLCSAATHNPLDSLTVGCLPCAFPAG